MSYFYLSCLSYISQIADKKVILPVVSPVYVLLFISLFSREGKYPSVKNSLINLRYWLVKSNFKSFRSLVGMLKDPVALMLIRD